MENLLSTENLTALENRQSLIRNYSFGFYNVSPYENNDLKKSKFIINYLKFDKENKCENFANQTKLPQLSIIKEDPQEKSLASQQESSFQFPIEEYQNSQENLITSKVSEPKEQQELIEQYKKHFFQSKSGSNFQLKIFKNKKNQLDDSQRNCNQIDSDLIKILQNSENPKENKEYEEIEKELKKSYSIKKLSINLDDSEEKENGSIMKKYKCKTPRLFQKTTEGRSMSKSAVRLRPSQSQNFIEQNIMQIEKFQKPRRKLENPTFTPKLNKKSLMMAEKRSVTPKSNRSILSDMSSTSNTFKANKKSDNMLTNKLLEEVYNNLLDLGLKHKKDQEMGDQEMKASDFFKFFHLMNFLPSNIPQFDENLMDKKQQFVMANFDKRFQKYEIQIQKIWNRLVKKNKKKIDVQSLTLFILDLYNLAIPDQVRKFSKKKIGEFQLIKDTRFEALKILKSEIKSQRERVSTTTDRSISRKNDQMVNNHRMKILKKYSKFIDEGLMELPSKSQLSHIDLLNIEKQIKMIERQKKKEAKMKEKNPECTFKPITNSYLSSKYTHSSFQSRLSKTEKALKLHIAIKDDDREQFFLQNRQDIDREIHRVKKKFHLSKKECQKLKSLLQSQWKHFESQRNQLIPLKYQKF